ncbi:MAG: DUF1540 domain-containing protein [Kiritimatiellae bacterium]|nr:DUF1540 domain-containing protein [Kiritimatiellia bacterium]
MKQVIEMPEVIQCEAKQCAYNTASTCHARAITVGNMQQHLCDTMIAVKKHTQRKEAAGVGACRSANCVHNEDLECQADGINITLSGGRAFCGTFAAK